MRKFLVFLLLVLIAVIVWQKDIVTRFIFQKVIYKDAVVVGSANQYYRSDHFQLIQNTDTFIIKDSSVFLDIIYTVLNNGWDEFTVFCDYTYETCQEDFLAFIEDTPYAEISNNYVHPFNSYNNINFTIDSLGKIEMKIDKTYTPTQIEHINEVMDNFLEQNIQVKMNDREKIKIFHDYLIEHTKYDEDYDLETDKSTYQYHPYHAYGPLIEGLGICSGYTDAMAIFLDKIGIPNYKISSKDHVWNLVYLEGKWYHLDLTWDDPVTSNGQEVILYDFYLITTKELRDKNTTQHDFEETFYPEAAENFTS